MATLISPGTSVSVTNQSFFFPAESPTVPVFFVATRSGKLQTDGITPAAGTLERGIIRTITSISQSLELFGVPYFQADLNGNEQHGDARNEYGLLALNQFLTTAGLAYVVRADIDLNDTPRTYSTFGVPVVVPNSTLYNGVGNGTIASVTAIDNTVKPQMFTVLFTSPTAFNVVGSLSGVVGQGTPGTPFTSAAVSFTVTAGGTPFVKSDSFTFNIGYTNASRSGTGNGVMVGPVPTALTVPETFTVTFTSATAFTVVGSVHSTPIVGTVGTAFNNTYVAFSIAAGSTPFAVADTLVVTATAVTVTAVLGSTDAQRRTAIVASLKAAVNSNTDVRSELYEYNLIACPGYSEVATEMVALATDILGEAMVIADVPCTKTPEQAAQWALTTERTSNELIAYYYPWCLTSNLDGRNVLGAPSGAVLRTIAFSDQQSYVWVAPAGVSRGVVTGVSKIGYVTGTLGSATTFVEANMSRPQRDGLYQYFRNINPITFFPGRGIIIWGQKTSAPAAGDTDRINAMRLVCYLRRVLRKGGQPFVFEPNDQITRDNLKARADAELSDIMAKRGLYDFLSKCDASNNTAARITKNELWLEVGIKIEKASEFIYIPIRLVALADKF